MSHGDQAAPTRASTGSAPAGLLLDVAALDVAYGRARVLHDVSLTLAHGEMAFVVGRNGAGKTTLLKTIAGFLSPIAGSIRLDGEPLTGLPAEKVARRGVRYVFQDKRVFSKLTVRENIQIAAHAARVPLPEAVDRVLQIYPRLSKFLDGPAGGLSGGQRQLLLIGRALVGSPKLLLIDEPTEGLAAGTIDEVFRVLSETKGKVSMLIVEQNLPVVRQLADRVYAMKEGRIPARLDAREEIQDRARLEQWL
jgi:ABC-type branched-subunit amino acid transport system ATPase component